MDSQKERILVTGVTGLVGARLLPRLVEAGFDCLALVRGNKEVPAGVTAVDGDLLHEETLAEAVKEVSAVVHLAAVFRTRDTDLIWKSNFEGTRNLIAAVKTHVPHARFILASTAHVYNSGSPYPGRENDLVNAEQAYPASKIAAEKELQESGLTYSILRFPFVYGDGDGHLESLPGHVIPAKWHPAARMSTIHHRDIASAIKMSLTGGMDGLIVNIADDTPASIWELVHLAGASMESSAEPLQNPWHLQVDTSLARSLGFQPTVRTVYQALCDGLM